ncbi:MAG: hypothetical protein DI546_07990 [Rhizobium sp.]|nr:MAG: hypothetical protein DI546_07990 [Rhizobium sp.]
MAYLDSYLTARKERLLKGKPKKPAQIIKGPRRQAVINEVMDRLGDWRMSPFENQGALHAGLRSAFCISGNTWLASEIEAASIVGESLRMIGAEYPTWDQGQPEHTIPDEQCKKCGGPMPEDAREGLRRYRFCSNECSRAALVFRTYENGWRNSTLAWSAYRMVLKTKTAPRECPVCKSTFSVVRQLSDAVYCSKACYNVGRLKRAMIQCECCEKPFQPARDSSKFCSVECKNAAVSMKAYDKECACCGEAFTAKSKKALFCSSSCKRKGKPVPRHNVIPFVPMHMLTTSIFDGWFRRAA